MDEPTRDLEPIDEPFALLLDDTASIVMEAAFSEYRDEEVMDLNPDVEEKRRARQLHNRLRETHALGAGATLTVNTTAEAQTVLNSLSHYSVEPTATYRQQCVEALTSALYDHAPVSLAHVPIITDFLHDDELRIQPDDLEPVDEESWEVEVDIAVKPGVDPV